MDVRARRIFPVFVTAMPFARGATTRIVALIGRR